MLVGGWAAHHAILDDGARQIVRLIVPGEVFGPSDEHDGGDIIALTSVEIAVLPMMKNERISAAHDTSRLLDKRFLFNQIKRLGRMPAYNRLIDFLVEVYARLVLSGQADDEYALVPLLQEDLADALGLTKVHINRVLRKCAENEDLRLTSRRLTLSSPLVARMNNVLASFSNR